MPATTSPSFVRSLLSTTLRLFFKPFIGPPMGVAGQRNWVELLGRTAGIPARGMVRARTTLGGVPCERIGLPGDEAARQAILYLHGGAFCLGSPATHRPLTTYLARDAKRPAWVIDYRLAPEHPWPAAREDAVAAYRGLLEQGLAPADIAIAGDSAGGALTLLTAVAIRDAGLPLPGALVMISPMGDFEAGGATLQTHAQRDPMLREGWLQQATQWLRGNGPALPSPIRQPLHGLPRTLIHVGSEEILLSDSETLAERLKAAGVSVQLKRWNGLWHVFHLHAGLLGDSVAAIHEIAEFLLRDGERAARGG